MTLKADLTLKEVARPASGRCASGHGVPPPSDPLGRFPRNDGDEPTPIRFFRVVGHGQDGVFCEPCLIVANHLAQRKKHASG